MIYITTVTVRNSDELNLMTNWHSIIIPLVEKLVKKLTRWPRLAILAPDI